MNVSCFSLFVTIYNFKCWKQIPLLSKYKTFRFHELINTAKKIFLRLLTKVRTQ